MNETLYEITRDLVLLKDFDALEPTNGEPEEDRLEQLQQALDKLNMKFADKVTNIVKFVKNLEAQCDAVACEAKRLSDRKKAIDSRIDWLKNYVKTAMQASESEKIKHALFTIYVGQSQPSVEVVDVEQIDVQFIRVKKEVDKVKILEQVKTTGVKQLKPGDISADTFSINQAGTYRLKFTFPRLAGYTEMEILYSNTFTVE